MAAFTTPHNDLTSTDIDPKSAVHPRVHRHRTKSSSTTRGRTTDQAVFEIQTGSSPETVNSWARRQYGLSQKSELTRSQVQIRSAEMASSGQWSGAALMVLMMMAATSNGCGPICSDEGPKRKVDGVDRTVCYQLLVAGGVRRCWCGGRYSCVDTMIGNNGQRSLGSANQIDPYGFRVCVKNRGYSEIIRQMTFIFG